MSSTFLTRLRVGSKLVDATGVSCLYRGEGAAPHRLLLAVAALIMTAVILAVFLMSGSGHLAVVSGSWHSLAPWLHLAL